MLQFGRYFGSGLTVFSGLVSGAFSGLFVGFEIASLVLCAGLGFLLALVGNFLRGLVVD